MPVTGCTYKLSGQLSQAVAAEYHLSLDESKAREGQYQSRHELEVEQADFHARQFTGKPMPGEKVANRLPNREAESRRGMGVNF